MLFVALAKLISGGSSTKKPDEEVKEDQTKKQKKQLKTPGPLSKNKSADEELNDLRESFTCPITGKLIVEPMSTIYGHMYEKDEIEKWVKLSGRCPVTKQPLTMDDLIPQFAVKNAIDNFRKMVGEEEPQPKKPELLS